MALIGGLAVPGVGVIGGQAAGVPSIAYAGKDDHDDDKSHKGKKEEERSEQFRSQRDDRQTSGQVMDINTLKDPPEIWIANMDGVVHVRMLTTDLIAKNGVRLGDHVTVMGEKISEVEFDCQDMSVDGHFGDKSDNKNDNN